MLVKTGQTYSRKLITQSQELISFRLGAEGYAFAKIDPVPTAHEDTKTIDLTFFVDAGNRAYVRRIGFINTSAIDDEVLRRELRQMEGSYLSNSLLERSKERLQRLPYIEEVDFETNPVPGTPDLVDVDFDVKEGLPGQFSGGIGYSESQSFMLTAASCTRTSWVRASGSPSSSSRAATRSSTASRIPTPTRTSTASRARSA